MTTAYSSAYRHRYSTKISIEKAALQLITTYQTLFDHYGEQYWWPGDSPFEIMVGAVLTQNTAWTNVEKAITALKQQNLLSAQAIVDCSAELLADAIRPSGYFNVKTKRLQSLCQWLLEQGGVESLIRYDSVSLRNMLLSVHGIGPETADDILLYALDRPVFVIDAYTRRIFSRLALFKGDEPYDSMRLAIEQDLSDTLSPAKRVVRYNEYHALIVRHAKVVCAKQSPACPQCCLKNDCPSASVFHPDMV